MPRRIVLNLSLDPELAQALDAFVASKPGEDRDSVAREVLETRPKRPVPAGSRVV